MAPAQTKFATPPEWVIIHHYLTTGWGLLVQRITDRAGFGEPADPRYPTVYDVKVWRFNPATDQHEQYFGRHGELLDALQQADRRALHIEDA